MSAKAHVFQPPEEAEVLVTEVYLVGYVKADGTQGYGFSVQSEEPLSAILGLLELVKADLLEDRHG